MRNRPSDLNIAGAVDLSGLKARATAPAAADGARPAAGVVVDVTEATFTTEVVERSRQVPVVLDFWAEWCQPCKQLSPVLEKLAAESGGAWVLAKVDCDAQPRLAQAAQVQGIPAVKAVFDGAIVSEFTGALPEREVRQWLAEILAFAQQRGAGAAAADGAAAGDPALADSAGADPALSAAEDALRRGDITGAVEAYRALVAANPADADAALALARCELLLRVEQRDDAEVRRRAAAAPLDVEAQAAAADLELAEGDVDGALSRLVDLVRSTSGDERAAAREHLLLLFTAVDPADPRLARARTALANALF